MPTWFQYFLKGLESLTLLIEVRSNGFLVSTYHVLCPETSCLDGCVHGFSTQEEAELCQAQPAKHKLFGFNGAIFFGLNCWWLYCWIVELLVCWIVDLLNCWMIKLFECWIVELLSCWIVVVEALDCWIVEVLKCCIVALLKCWSVEVLNYWIIELLIVELLNYW